MKKLPKRLPRSMIEVAKLEIEAWCRSGKINEGLVMIVLFAFIHRFTTGKTLEESFFPQSEAKEPEYFI